MLYFISYNVDFVNVRKTFVNFYRKKYEQSQYTTVNKTVNYIFRYKKFVYLWRIMKEINKWELRHAFFR